MNDQMYYNRQEEMNTDQQRQTLTMIMLALGLAVGALLAIVVASKARPKPKTFRDRLDDSLDSGREATAKALKQLEKDFADLRKKVEERLAEIR